MEPPVGFDLRSAHFRMMQILERKQESGESSSFFLVRCNYVVDTVPWKTSKKKNGGYLLDIFLFLVIGVRRLAGCL